MNENWLMTRTVLDKFARHYKTGEPMPEALAKKIEASETFNQGFATVEYLSSALVDMKLHTTADGVVDPDKFEREALAELGMPKEMVMRHRLPQFGHLFSSDSYSAGYYSYLWSETMDADTWEAFERPAIPMTARSPTRSGPICCRPATKPTGPKPIASSAGAIRRLTRCSSGAASRPTRRWVRPRGSSRPACRGG